MLLNINVAVSLFFLLFFSGGAFCPLLIAFFLSVLVRYMLTLDWWKLIVFCKVLFFSGGVGGFLMWGWDV